MLNGRINATFLLFANSLIIFDNPVLAMDVLSKVGGTKALGTKAVRAKAERGESIERDGNRGTAKRDTERA